MEKPDRWARIKELFGAALERDPSQRSAFLNDACGPDVDLRREVESLLSEHEKPNDLSHIWPDAVLAESAPESIGPYRLIKKLGEGGMGQVWLAERVDGSFKRTVALKLPLFSIRNKSFAERFARERDILASLEHPHIARLYDAGVTSNGQPFLALEFVEGMSLTQYCDRLRLPLRQRINLFLQVLAAVQYAHRNLVVHRDLKPSNILVTFEGQARLLDFGIAKMLSQGEAKETELTQVGGRVLTPQYASPEQILGQPVTTASDVYSLGVVLYELLCGELPYRLKRDSRAALEEAILAADSVRPSHAAMTEAAVQARSASVKKLRRALAGDLDTIVLKALKRNPSERYATADAFAQDLEHYGKGEPVLAQPESAWYRTRKFLGRNKLAAASVLAIFVALAAGLGTALWQARRAERRFADVRHLANVFLFDFEKSIHNVPGTTQARQLVVNTALEYLQKLYRDAAGDPALTREVASAYEKVGDIQGAGMANVGNTSDAVHSYELAIRLRRSLNDAGSRASANRLALAGVLVKLAAVQARTNDLDAAVHNCREAMSLSEAVLHDTPGDPAAESMSASAYLQLPFVLYRRNEIQEAINTAQQGLELRKKLAAASPGDRATRQDLALAYYINGDLQARLNHRPEAITGYQKALEFNRQLLAERSDDSVVRRQLMIVLARLSFLQLADYSRTRLEPSSEAVTNAREAFTIAEQALKADPWNAEALSDVNATAVNLGQILTASGRLDEANQLLKRAVQAATDLVQHDPGSRENRLNLALSHSNLATFLSTRGDTARALQEQKVAVAILEKLSAESPNDAKVLHPYAYSYLSLGKLLGKRREWAAAQLAFQQGLAIAETGASRNPGFASLADDLRTSSRQVSRHLSEGH